MTRRTLITMSTGALVAPFVYAITPSQSLVVKMEAPRNLLKDMHTMWLGAIDQTKDDKYPGKILLYTLPEGRTYQQYFDQCQMYVGIWIGLPSQIPQLLKPLPISQSNIVITAHKIVVSHEMIEALAIAWMDTAANYSRRMTDEEMAEFRMQFDSFATQSTVTHYERLALNLDKFSIADKFYKGEFKTPMQEEIAMAIQFNGAIDLVMRIHKTA